MNIVFFETRDGSGDCKTFSDIDEARAYEQETEKMSLGASLNAYDKFIIDEDGYVRDFEAGKRAEDCRLSTESIDCVSDDIDEQQEAEELAISRLYERIGMPSGTPLFIGVRQGDKCFCARIGSPVQ